ncbi:MAG TPA: 2-oxo acid dehydrogenase subunit E2 [Drouetiella sp.]
MMSPSRSEKEFEFVSFNPLRKNLLDMIVKIGRASVPATLFYDVDMSKVEESRAGFKQNDRNVTVTAYLLKAIAKAQLNHPATRTQMLPNGSLVQLNKVCGQLTVEREIDGEPVLFFGEIRDLDTKSLTQISEELFALGHTPVEHLPNLAMQYRFGNFPELIRQVVIFIGLRFPSVRLKYMGATFGLSSMGKFGCRNIISPCVVTSMFCIGEVEKRPFVDGEKIVTRPQMSLVLNFDHRVMDGGVAARFVEDVIKLLTERFEELN